MPRTILKSIPYLLLIVIYIIIINYIEWASISEILKASNPLLLITAACLSILYPFIGARRWATVLRALDITISPKDSMRSIMMAFAANVFLPAKSGDFLKAFMLESTVDKTTLTSGVIAERIGDLLALATLIFIGAFIVSNSYVYISSIFCIVTFIIVISMQQHFLLKSYKNKLIMAFLGSLRLFSERSKIMFTAFLFSLLNWIVGAFQILYLFKSFSIDLNFFEVLFRFLLTVLVSIIPITPGGIGIRESAYILVFQPFASHNVSFLIGITYYLSTTVLLSAVGFYFVVKHLDKTLIAKLQRD